MNRHNNEHGSAIIVVLLILSVMVIVSTNITVKYNSEFLRTANFINGIQTKWYGVASEELAARVLHQDFEDNHNTINLSGYWAAPERSSERMLRMNSWHRPFVPSKSSSSHLPSRCTRVIVAFRSPSGPVVP
ncbi:MAG: general secretion pathway protein GspK, partial [Succinivibrionaceae bacterium]|nr:general secretion pathway protein GspK [Succinivibrionaceae bacterium]